MIDIAASFALDAPAFSVVLAKRVPADRTGPLAATLTSGVAKLKRELRAGGLLQSVPEYLAGQEVAPSSYRSASFSRTQASLQPNCKGLWLSSMLDKYGCTAIMFSV